MQEAAENEKDIIALLEQKLRDLRMNYNEELNSIMKEIEQDIRNERESNDTEKKEDLRNQLGI